MAICGHCNKKVKGIRDHIKAKHGFPFYCEAPDLKCYGKNEPPRKQVHEWPDKKEV